MDDRDRIETARDEIADWFDWNRHRMATPMELANELELAPADVSQALSELAALGELAQHGDSYHVAPGRTARGG